MTESTKKIDIKRNWHLINAQGEILGRLASKIAEFLIGKTKPNFVRYLDCGDYVVVINSQDVAVTGKKEKEKTYGHYSGHPGGLKEKALWQLRIEKPNEIIERAVAGMLPKNKLRDRLMTRLHVYKDATHPYEDKFKAQQKSK